MVEARHFSQAFEEVFSDLPEELVQTLQTRFKNFPQSEQFLNSPTPGLLDPAFFWNYGQALALDLEALDKAFTEKLALNIRDVTTEVANAFLLKRARDFLNLGLYPLNPTEYYGYFRRHGILMSPEIDISVVQWPYSGEGVWLQGFIGISEPPSTWKLNIAKEGYLYIYVFAPVFVQCAAASSTEHTGQMYKFYFEDATEAVIEFYGAQPFTFSWSVYSNVPSITVNANSSVPLKIITPIGVNVSSTSEGYVYTFTGEYLDTPLVGVPV